MSDLRDPRGLVVFWAQKFSKDHPLLTIEELVSVGNMSAWIAEQSYDDERGMSFYSWCSRQIRWGMLNYVRNTTKVGGTRKPETLVVRDLDSLDRNQTEDSEEPRTLHDMVPDLSRNTHEEAMGHMFLEAIPKLPDPLGVILFRRMQGYLDREIADELGCSRTQVTRLAHEGIQMAMEAA